MALQFFSESWAKAAADAVNAGPSEEVRAGKLDKYWEWIDRAKEGLDCTLGLCVEDADWQGPSCLLLVLRNGECVEARLVDREEAERAATYLLAGDLEAWHQIMAGYDMGKTIMYRKLRLVQGELLEFFRAAYFWTESLGCVQRIDTIF